MPFFAWLTFSDSEDKPRFLRSTGPFLGWSAAFRYARSEKVLFPVSILSGFINFSLINSILDSVSPERTLLILK